MLTEDEIYCNEQMDLKHSETGKISKIILFIFTISWGPPSQPRKLKKNTSTRPACHSLLDFGWFSQVMAARLFVIFEAIFASFSVGGA